jgi:hypothetical protein
MTQPVPPGARASCFDASSPELDGCVYDPPVCRDEGEPISQNAKSILPEPPDRPGGEATSPALRFCRDADTVVEGFLCGEPTVVSDACRQPHNRFDEFVCDDPRMQALQATVLEKTATILKTLFFELIRRM